MDFNLIDLGLIDFKEAWLQQKTIFEQVKNRVLESALIVCKHYQVITLGRQAKKENLKFSEEEIKKKGIAVYEIERGGDVTYHGPGQLTVYPIFNLSYFKKDIHWYLRLLEGIIIDLLSDFGIKGIRHAGLTGVWVGKKKIGSIGIAIKNWITFHGLSINIKKTT